MMPETANISRGAGPLVIIVLDDDAAVRSSLKFALETEGFLVRAYSRGDQLMADTSLGDCACLIVDQKLPGMTGLDVVAAVRGRHITTPAILITTNPSIVVQDRAAKAGVAIVEKPLLGNALIDRVRAAIAGWAAAR
jgi:two-component system, LuxR family, response regulator FixJ